ncbi:HNH endonuclease [Micromonospora marina]|uniref:HNH endonuclease n=1 Tax=Micromonospora marina TaxID=307120 RepID=UPI003D748B41
MVDSGPCVYCGSADDTTVDHIVALAQGGHEAEYNLVPACNPCNSSKSDTPLGRWYPERVAHASAHSMKVRVALTVEVLLAA